MKPLLTAYSGGVTGLGLASSDGLAPGTVLAAGASGREKVVVAGAGRVRIRAKTTGVATLRATVLLADGVTASGTYYEQALAANAEGVLTIENLAGEGMLELQITAGGAGASVTHVHVFSLAGPGDIELNASEAHIGAAGGHGAQVAAAGLAVTAAQAYAAGFLVGGKLTFAGAFRLGGPLTGLLQSLFIMDRSNQKPPLELILFNADPAATTFNDRQAFAIHANDLDKVIRRITISAAEFIQVGGVSIADLSPGSRLVSGGATALFGALVTTGAPTFGAATDLSCRAGFLQD